MNKYITPYLAAEYMSEDELVPNSYPVEYRIFNSAWMSTNFRQLLRAADHIVRYEFKKNLGSRSRRGNPPRVRKPSGETRPSTAPKGLPRCCYDDTWFNSLGEVGQRLLHAQDIECDLQVPEVYRYLFKDAPLST